MIPAPAGLSGPAAAPAEAGTERDAWAGPPEPRWLAPAAVPVQGASRTVAEVSGAAPPLDVAGISAQLVPQRRPPDALSTASATLRQVGDAARPAPALMSPEVPTPAALLDPVRPRRPSAVARDDTPAPESQAPEHGRTEPTEVHVHIGRIEVTAVHEPPVRRVDTESRRPALSLDDYLARRSGERR